MKPVANISAGHDSNAGDGLALAANQPLASCKQFRKQVELSQRQICQRIWADGGAGQRVKNEATAVANLERIIRATLKLANKKGFAATSLRDLSAETGLSMGGLYAYIGGKDELAALIQHHGRALIHDVMQQQMAAETTAVGRLRAGVRSHLFLSEVLQAWFFFCFMEARYLAKPQKAAAIESEQQTETIFRELLEQGSSAGEFVVTDAGLSASMLKALLQDWYLKRGKYRRRNISVERYADHVLVLMLGHLADANGADIVARS